MGRIFPFLFLAVLAFFSSCGPAPVVTVEGPTARSVASVAPEEGGQAMAFELRSDMFGPGESIPSRYTCDGEDISPPLDWSDAPQGTQSFVLVADDPDAPMGTWVHWVLYDVAAETRGLPEAVPADASLSGGGRHGKNSWPRLGYGGPCPPSGTHRYFFKLYALDTMLGLEGAASKQEVLQAMEGHILGQAQLMGVYRRQ